MLTWKHVIKDVEDTSAHADLHKNDERVPQVSFLFLFFCHFIIFVPACFDLSQQLKLVQSHCAASVCLLVFVSFLAN